MTAYAHTESDFERDLIDKLRTGEINLTNPGNDLDFNQVHRSKLWDYRPDIKTTAQLEENFKQILERNNQDRLDGPLTPGEFKQVMDQINALSTPYKAGRFLYGMNGVSQVEVDLENGKHEYLTVFDQSQIGAGNTVYQVVNQIERPAVVPGNKDRRFDVTLLINGLPIYQIELKKDTVGIDEALNQIQQYVQERQFTGIFSTVQIFMAMSPIGTKYMAATTADAFNKDFAFMWKDEKNRNVRDWEYIADHMLTIPAAHLLSTSYMILDGTDGKECIKVMRPYQVAATRKSLEALKNTDFDQKLNKDGYIWHTTGSGKTITSYKTATLANRIPKIDKVVFLVDRKSLTRQTLDSYRAYDPEHSSEDRQEYTSIRNTENTTDLGRQLKKKGNDIIITSHQKLKRLIKRDNFKAPDKNILFIVDEAHRSTGTEAFGEIQKAFPHSAWIGYSGTPNFDEKQKGNRTVDVFGKLLHAYTIVDAISDHNVLGFKVEFNTTVTDEAKEQQLISYYHEMYPKWTEEQIREKIGALTPEDMDDNLTGSFYDYNAKHVEAVAKDIVTNWKNRSSDGRYNALLTTHVAGNKASIPMAQMYYDEFKRLNEIARKYGQPELKVAISISMDETNKDDMPEKNKKFKEAIDDYNKMFGTSWDSTTIEEYNSDLEMRLSKRAKDGKYLDLVIVVDRLLTGFDAPGLNTLYVDRTLKGANLIQAYSRTNRIIDSQTKPFGNIVNYRWPEYCEKLMNDAFAEYSNKEHSDDPAQKPVKPDTPPESVIAISFDDQVKQTTKILKTIKDLTHDLDHIPDTYEKQVELLRAMRQYNAQIAKLKQYPLKVNEDGEVVEGFDYDHPEELFTYLGITEKDSQKITTSLTNEVKKAIALHLHTSPHLIDLRVEHLKDVIINYDYLTTLLEDLLNQVHENRMDEATETKKKIYDFTTELEDRDEARDVNDAAEAIYTKEYPVHPSDIVYPVKITSRDELMTKIRHAKLAFVDKQMLNFMKKWGIQNIVDTGSMRRLISGHRFQEDDLDQNFLNQLKSQARKVYKEYAEDEEVRAIKKLAYGNQLGKALMELADEQITR